MKRVASRVLGLSSEARSDHEWVFVGKPAQLDIPEVSVVRRRQHCPNISVTTLPRAASFMGPCPTMGVFSHCDNESTFESGLTSWAQTSPGPENEVKAAINLIRSAEKFHSSSLKINQLKLRSLPDCLEQLKALETLDVSQNCILNLPAKLPPNLRNLYANSNALTQLPVLPGSLVDLNVNLNWLSSLPENLPRTLVELFANQNALRSLPNDLPSGLKHLSVNGNFLVELPTNLPIGLEDMAINSNLLTSIPENLPPRLGCLGVNSNLLVTLPEKLPKNLKYIWIYGNKITHLPSDLPASIIDIRMNFFAGLSLSNEVRQRNIVRLS